LQTPDLTRSKDGFTTGITSANTTFIVMNDGQPARMHCPAGQIEGHQYD
jgi:hypothetical protein